MPETPETTDRYDDFEQRMFDMSDKEWEKNFQGIANYILVNKASEDGRLQRRIHWIVNDPMYPEPSEEEDIIETLAQIRDELKLDPEQVMQAYNICMANTLRKDVDHGQA